MEFEASARSRDYLKRIQDFMAEHIEPMEHQYHQTLLAQNHGADHSRWVVPPELEELKAKAREAGLWNLFLPDDELGAGLSNVEYAPLAEQMGRSFIAPVVLIATPPTRATWKCCGNTARPSRRTPG